MSDDEQIWSEDEPIFATPDPQKIREPESLEQVTAQNKSKKYTSIRSDYYGPQ